MANTRHRESRTLLRLLLQDPKIAPHLAALRAYHPDTARHSIRVASLALDLGIENRLSTEELVWQGTGALLHDRGKTQTPIGILTKPSPLDAYEFEIMDDHPRQGYILLADFPAPVRAIVVGHHEHQADPYPRSGINRRKRPSSDRRTYLENIRELTQMVAAADMFDALTSARGYKPALPISRVAELMEQEYRGDPIFRRQMLERAA